ncbi:hypothetical protein IJ384_00445 [bacterium]|nr:hypothetical protein [bacterium]
MKKFILLILFIFLTLPIFASNWIIIDAETQISKQHLKSYNTNSNIKADIFYSYLSKDMNVVSNSDIYINLEKNYDIEIAYCIRFILINATQQKYTNKSIALFDKNDQLIEEVVFDNDKLIWRNFAPNSKIAKILECIIEELKN